MNVHLIELCGVAQDIYQMEGLYRNSITLHGNIDLSWILQNGTAEQVERDVLEGLERFSGKETHVWYRQMLSSQTATLVSHNRRKTEDARTRRC